MQKALKTANSEKFVFSCQTSKVAPEPRSSPLVTALSPLAFWSQKCAKAAPVPGTRSPQGFPRSDSPPRTCSEPGSRGGPSARRGGPSARRACHQRCHRSVRLRFWCKKRSKRSSPKSSFFRVRHRFVTALSPLSLGPKSAQKHPSSQEDSVLGVAKPNNQKPNQTSQKASQKPNQTSQRARSQASLFRGRFPNEFYST